MPNLFIFIGLQRCGTHAITNWIIKQRDEKVYDKITSNKDTKGVFTYLTESYPIFYFNSQKIDKSILEQRETENAVPAFDGLHDVVVAFEDGDCKDYNEDKLFEGLFVDHYNIVRIISLRDVWNCFASFYKKYGEVPIHIQRLWEERAEEILYYTNYLGRDFYFIDYNNWSRNRLYRENVAYQLDLVFTDNGFNDVPNFGNGSSFTQLDMDGKGSQMPVLSRYREFKNDPNFRRLITPYKEKLSQRIFLYENRPDE